ncbi:MAG TPA: flagellar biosynthesis protein FlhA [Candidatus Sulfotelmatobacter sp.]|nr:flagellar biosynthesis protein FlhA [Candidatus Sulfotelmatobacter sp.]
MATAPKPLPLLATGREAYVPIAAVAIVFVMIVPVPALVLDLLLAMSITLAVLVLLASLQILKPVEFSVFPTLILLLTLFRLSLNLASTRRILLHGSEGTAAAGKVIESFGQFVVGGNYVVGFVVFLALIAIQYLVINHGAVRTAEVSARFTLDAMPGKQMAIDADLNAGLIDERNARSRREQITREAEFYGAMDGAARFSQRDALATILITAINIIAGFLIGVFQQGMQLRDALTTYTILTVGDGLVTLIPSLLVSVSGGIVVTRASSDVPIGVDLTNQLLAKRRTLFIAATVMSLLTLIPGLPKFSFLVLAGGIALLGMRLKEELPAKAKEAEAERKPSPQEQLETLLKLDDISVEVGYGLIPLVDQKAGGQMLPRIRALRRHLATELGFIVPAIHITDNMRLKPREYVLRLRGVEIARGETYQDWLLAISSEASPPALEGIETREPAFGVPARWIPANLRDTALGAGYAVVEQTSVIATHLAEVIRRHAHEVLTRQETKRLLDSIAETHPKLVEELVPRVLSLGETEKILQQLLREQVSIRDLSTILETLIDASALNRNLVFLVESVRQALGRALVQPLLQDDGKLKVLAVDPNLEDEINRAFDPQAAASRNAALQTGFLRRVLDGLRRIAGEQLTVASPILLCGSPARFHLRRVLEPFVPRIVVLSPAEIPAVVAVQSMGVVQ